MKKGFGSTSMGKASLYTIFNSKGVKAELTDYGARLVSLYVPDKNGNMVDVILGHNNAEEYETDKGTYFGVSVGRNANRIANAEFTIDGIRYELEKNDGKNNLHSGKNGLGGKLWEIREHVGNSITFTIFAPDMEEGFPGNAEVDVTFFLNEENGLEIYYHAVSDKKTTFNMTNHSYFNLNGEASGSIYGQWLQIMASGYTPNSDESVPLGFVAPVEGTPFDFTSPKKIGQDIDKDDIQLQYGHGYDHNFALNKKYPGKKALETAAIAYAEESGIVMEALTDLPGMQLYTGNYIEGYSGKGNHVYHKRDGFCLETQYFPNSINEPSFEASVSDAGEVYETTTVYRFSVRK